MFQPYPEDHLHLRLHRARSVVLTPEELVEIRAAQRTFEGAYMRTALGQFSFALIILKIFTSEFYAIGALFAVYGAAVMLVAIYRRYEGHRQFFTSPAAGATPYRDEPDSDLDRGPDGGQQQQQQQQQQQRRRTSGSIYRENYHDPPPVKKFRTSGNSVALLAALSLSAYIILLVLTWQLGG